MRFGPFRCVRPAQCGLVRVRRCKTAEVDTRCEPVPINTFVASDDAAVRPTGMTVARGAACKPVSGSVVYLSCNQETTLSIQFNIPTFNHGIFRAEWNPQSDKPLVSRGV